LESLTSELSIRARRCEEVRSVRAARAQNNGVEVMKVLQLLYELKCSAAACLLQRRFNPIGGVAALAPLSL
jgi:hypothetical protein